MSKVPAALIGVALIAAPGFAFADEAKGAITAILPDNKAIVLDGYTYIFPAEIQIADFKPGHGDHRLLRRAGRAGNGCDGRPQAARHQGHEVGLGRAARCGAPSLRAEPALTPDALGAPAVPAKPKHGGNDAQSRGRFVVSVAALAGTPAPAAAVQGRVEAINSQTRTVTLNGVAYVFPENIGMVHLIPSDQVVLTFNTTGQGNVVEKATKTN
ncbi:MAG: DUF1344 domain-containing protein [Alphaproteobacteria bacterium]|nr:DUF1344 domain-containing protein [Alphaproteobacteria bacterium]